MKFKLNEAALKEDEAVFDIDDSVVFPSGIESNRAASDILAYEINDWDITDKTDQLKAWIKKAEEKILKQNYDIWGQEISVFENEFLTDVLGFEPLGPELQYNLVDFGVELKFNTGIDSTSGVIPPIPESPSRDRKTAKHIVHKKMQPAILIGWSKLYVRRIAEFIIVQLLMDGVLSDTIINAIGHLWVFEHIDKVENLTRYLRKVSLEYIYAKHGKEFDTIKQLKAQLEKYLDGVEWELICCHEGDAQKNIIKGVGLTQSLLDWLDEKDFYITSFKITDADI